MALKDLDLSLPLPDVFPKAWKNTFHDNFDFFLFRNLDHFKYEVAQLKQKKDDNCGVTYAEAVSDLVAGRSNFPESEQESIRNLVRSKLLKRGLITEEIYEEFKFSSEGTQVGIDVGKYAAGEPDCVITPARQYIDFFHELYISISYPYWVKNEFVRANVAKLLATVEELERQHIFIKITVVAPALNIHNSDRRKCFMTAIPLFHHKEPKSVAVMSSVVNERLLRKFVFAVLEDHYKKDLSVNYGNATSLPDTINIGEELNEIELFESIVKTVGA